MKNVLLCFGFVACVLISSAKSEYFSDVSEEEYKKLQEIAKFLLNRYEKGEATDSSELDSENEPINPSSKIEVDEPFVYTFPKVNPNADDSVPFGVGPDDPRFYQDASPSIESPSPEGFYENKEKRPEAKVSLFPSTKSFSHLSDEVPMVSDNKDSSSSAVLQIPVTSVYDREGKADMYFTAIVAGCSAAAVVAVITIGLVCYRLQKNAKAAADVDYPAYGVTGPNKDVSPTSGDRRLAQSAQMYHYQHQKQQIIAMESMTNKERRGSISDPESEEENEEGDYTVYECPGFLPPEMEVENPLFQDDQTPASVKPTNESSEEPQELPK